MSEVLETTYVSKTNLTNQPTEPTTPPDAYLSIRVSAEQIPRWAGGWACTSHPGVLGSIPKREEPGKTGAPCIKVPVRKTAEAGLAAGARFTGATVRACTGAGGSSRVPLLSHNLPTPRVH